MEGRNISDHIVRLEQLKKIKKQFRALDSDNAKTRTHLEKVYERTKNNRSTQSLVSQKQSFILL